MVRVISASLGGRSPSTLTQSAPCRVHPLPGRDFTAQFLNPPLTLRKPRGALPGGIRAVGEDERMTGTAQKWARAAA